MTDQKIVDRIKKMLNLARSANQHEAATAMAMAQRLLEKHSLTLGDLNLENIVEGYTHSRFSVSKTTQYESALAHTVDRAFGVGHFWRPGHSHLDNPYGYYVFVGPEDQLQLAVWTFGTLADRLKKARAKLVRDYKAGTGKSLPSAEADTFCLGWTYAIWHMVHEFAQPEAVRNAIRAQIEATCQGHVNQPKSATKGSISALNLGQEEGAKERLYRPVEGEQQLRITNHN